MCSDGAYLSFELARDKVFKSTSTLLGAEMVHRRRISSHPLTISPLSQTVAAGGEGGPTSGQAHRVSQAYELSRMVKEGARRGHHVICVSRIKSSQSSTLSLLMISSRLLQVGDFNSTPPSIAISLLRSLGGLSDSFLSLNPQLSWESVSLPPTSISMVSDSNSNSLEARRSIKELGITCDSPLNTWTSGKPLDENAKRGAGKRLDYIFWRSPEPTSKEEEETESYQLIPHKSEVCFIEKIPGLGTSYSDHFGLETTFQIQRSSPSILTSETQVLAQMEGSPSLEDTLSTTLNVLNAGLMASRTKQRKYLSLFAICLTVALGLIAFSVIGNGGVWGGVYTLFAVVAGWGGTTMFYSAVLGSEWERSEYILELVNDDQLLLLPSLVFWFSRSS